MNIFLVIVFSLTGILCQDMGYSTQCDSRSSNLTEIEKICMTDPEVVTNAESLLDKIQENVQSILGQAKKLFNVAKKKLGLESNDDSSETPKKCEYYTCIFRKMGVLTSDKQLNKTVLNQWIGENVKNADDKMVYSQTENCFKNLTMINSENKEMNQNTNACISSLTLMDCLSSEILCPIFKFP